MFNQTTEIKVRELELVLQQIPNKEVAQDKEEENIFQNIKNYFTGNSNTWYSYEYDEKTNNIKYSFPRTFVWDLKSIKNYFVKLFN